MELLGLAEVADVLRVSKQNVANWRARRQDFPPPVANLKSGPVWSTDAIVEWAAREGLEIDPPKASAASQQNETRATVVAMMNMKGGVGKSTLAANLGWYGAARLDHRVLLVDLDPQFNLSQYVLGVQRFEELLNSDEPTIDDLFRPMTGDKPPVHASELIQQVTNYDDGSCLHLIPARLELAFNVRLATERAHILRDSLEDVITNYDVIILDCSPTESILTWAAYYASDYIVVPVKPEFLSTIGLPLLIKSVDAFKAQHPADRYPDILGIIFNDSSDKVEHLKSKRFVRETAHEFNIPIFDNEISHSDSYPAGARKGQPIFWTNNARDLKKSELARAAREFYQKVGL
ncbi:AAA family ATPase [Pelagerythrobacter aerophilus]|uniref:ParA family protein n=1 Tax=Pelagerythrobacter aerophilus TaxID=2306995 RepID=A0A418NMR1_9SPHN|nr:AAA family ATPase [Pelagerythrobacter aerophilus]RIV81434.1 ParA family protein [Pelagerythrobacter aerophilus]